MNLTQEVLRQQLDYCPETGVFTRKVRAAQRVKVGDVAGSKDRQGYVTIRVLGTTYKAHRLAWMYVHGDFPQLDIDHINRNPSDNRLTNLRLANRSENTRNSRKRSDNKSGIKGVYWCMAAKKWAALCWANGRQNYLGVFSSKDAAGAAYSDFAKQHHGDFFPTNRSI